MFGTLKKKEVRIWKSLKIKKYSGRIFPNACGT